MSLFIYRNDSYRRLISQMNKYQKLIAQQKESLKDKTSAKKKLSRTEDQLKMMSMQLMPFNMRASGVNVVIVMIAYALLNQMFSGIVVAKLPFEPFTFLQSLSHRNLPGEDYTEVSAHLVFALSLLVLRIVSQKILESYDIKPKAPQQVSIWQMASEEAEKAANKF